MAETADEDLARVIELLKCGDVNKLILEFGSHNTIGSLLYFMTSMAQTPQGLAGFSSLFRALVRSAVGLRWVERCGVALVQPCQSGLPQKTIDDIIWINDRICALPVQAKSEMSDQFWHAWQRYNIK
jgi:hypothetical protein